MEQAYVRDEKRQGFRAMSPISGLAYRMCTYMRFYPKYRVILLCHYSTAPTRLHSATKSSDTSIVTWLPRQRTNIVGRERAEKREEETSSPGQSSSLPSISKSSLASKILSFGVGRRTMVHSSIRRSTWKGQAAWTEKRPTSGE